MTWLTWLMLAGLIAAVVGAYKSERENWKLRVKLAELTAQLANPDLRARNEADRADYWKLECEHIRADNTLLRAEISALLKPKPPEEWDGTEPMSVRAADRVAAEASRPRRPSEIPTDMEPAYIDGVPAVQRLSDTENNEE